MRKIALLLSSTLLLTGCATLLGDETDVAACEAIAAVVSTQNISLDSLTPIAVAEKLRSEVSPLAEGTLADRIDALAVALEGAELDTAAAGAAASEIGLRCALSGVNFDLSVIGQLVN